MKTLLYHDGAWVTAEPVLPRGRTLTAADAADAVAARVVVEGVIPSGARLVSAVVTLGAERGIATYLEGNRQKQVRF